MMYIGVISVYMNEACRYTIDSSCDVICDVI